MPQLRLGAAILALLGSLVPALEQKESVELHTHYGARPCRWDEQLIQVGGLSMCSSQCTRSLCPYDMPSGVSAYPKCALEDADTGELYCVLECDFTSECDKTHGARCRFSGGLGFCTYGMSGFWEALPVEVYAPNGTSPVAV